MLKPFFKLSKAIPIPDLTADRCNELDTSAIVKEISTALENDNNILLYPQ